MEGTVVILYADTNILFIYSCVYSPNIYLMNTYYIQAQYWEYSHNQERLMV